MGVVVGKVAPSVHAAYQAVAETLPVSIASVYNKLNRMEPEVTGALVRHTAQRLGLVIGAMGGQLPGLLPGYRVRILDGNHLAATERRLKVLHLRPPIERSGFDARRLGAGTAGPRTRF